MQESIEARHISSSGFDVANRVVEPGEYILHQAQEFYSKSRTLKLNADGTATLTSSLTMSNVTTSSFDDFNFGPVESGWTTNQEILHGTWAATTEGAITFHVTGCDGEKAAARHVSRQFMLPRAGTNGIVTNSIPFVNNTSLDLNQGLLLKKN
eukprot:TRINITY_DN13615_c0_g3_i2.p1 TRINITY_DN13615_c0_g3~~TRINITY_DN13615_c0_g3_i2.p1  ORF type:complete len:175 (+),score=25.29 TRINITY_DN13615_c0_g3_i2:67-525(+)